ncbi:MAG: sugar ABC transporter ATP-binding protein, partial [Clostridiales bacterium]|nr:sugar ABC transporter ATP-binding protein [Clostridiales bacterium]
NTQCATLSGGNQQKVILGRWMITKPKVLLLDEPTRGIDVGSKAEIYALISTLASQGIGIIVISSDLPEILGITDRIITLCEGRQTGHFLKGEATQETLLHAATSIKEGAE